MPVTSSNEYESTGRAMVQQIRDGSSRTIGKDTPLMNVQAANDEDMMDCPQKRLGNII
ncbi:hypothetical protein COCMIDRAFT_10006 [Bipolaris oryzae ATCC 44560]|uniref:Uncharacterized protein n=1 Tax=Bipolaris oryzae ATCC 44560 TaxID=930090 RepID=W6YQW7_COCMI|nr:uncharacterized protein COCMIDRAFT_10006 [Bipolaris oryzae ATCC 44560]EUC40030.1 hypothetical protein COCMIDRAFT_10006 [Bipolaris oryzae ATCC 44560]